MNKRAQWTGIVGLAVLIALLIGGCVVPDEPGKPTEPPPVSDGTDTASRLPTCESVENRVLALGFEDEMREHLATVGDELGIEFQEKLIASGESIWLNGEQEKRYAEATDGEYRKPFDSFWQIAIVNTDNSEADELFAEGLRGRGVNASLDYQIHLFEHSGGDSPFGKQPFPAPMPPSGTPDMRAQFALNDVLEVQKQIATPEPATHNTLDPKEIVVGVFDTGPSAVGVQKFSWIEEKVLGEGVGATWYAGTPAPTPNSRDHGVFVSSLVDAVAPDATVLLYRVLDDNGQGWTSDIFTQTLAFLAAYPPSAENPRVLNYSLGINCSEPPPKGWMLELDPFDALDVLLTAAEQRGAVIVAAAGNDSNRLSQPDGSVYVLDAAYPASGAFAIGVGAANFKGAPSCYSHDADVFAPGGDGVTATATAPGSTPIPTDAVIHCVPNHMACTDGSCEYGLLGLSAESPSGFAYWPGTSFSTPLVSGLVARYLAQHGDGMPPAPRAWVMGCAQPIGGEEVLLSIGNCPPVP